MSAKKLSTPSPTRRGRSPPIPSVKTPPSCSGNVSGTPTPSDDRLLISLPDHSDVAANSAAYTEQVKRKLMKYGDFILIYIKMMLFLKMTHLCKSNQPIIN